MNIRGRGLCRDFDYYNLVQHHAKTSDLQYCNYSFIHYREHCRRLHLDATTIFLHYSKNRLVRYLIITIYSILQSTPLNQSIFGVILRYSDF